MTEGLPCRGREGGCLQKISVQIFDFVACSEEAFLSGGKWELRIKTPERIHLFTLDRRYLFLKLALVHIL